MATKKSSNRNKRSGSFFSSKYLLIVIGLVLFSGIGAYYVFFSKAAAPVTNAPAAPSVYFSPTSQTVGASATFTTDVYENSGTTTVNAVQTNITYDTTKFTYVSIDTTTSAFGVEAEKTVNTTAGTIRLARGVSSGATVTGPKLIARITFQSAATGGTGAINFTTGTALVSSVTNANLLPGPAAYGNASYIIDTAGPTVSISAPVANANVELGSTSTISATATDAASDVTKVEFYVDGALKSTDTTSPYSYAWPTTGVAIGSHSLTARAYDTYNNMTTSTAVAVNLRDSIAPTVSITSPVANATVSATTTISATAADNTGGLGLAKVEFYVDNVLKATDTTAPFAYAWDTKTATDASHALTAKAYDNAATANVATSASVTVIVDNSDRTPPTAPASLRTTGNTYTSIALAWNASTDNVGVTGYRLARNGTTIYTGPLLAFNDTGLTSGTSYTYTVVALDAANNVSTATTLAASSKVQKVGDINGDDLIDIFDLSTLLSKWSMADADCDLNKSGTVDIFDLSILLTNWGK